MCCKEVNCIVGFCIFFFFYCIMRICDYMVIKIFSLGVVFNFFINFYNVIYLICFFFFINNVFWYWVNCIGWNLMNWLIFYLNLCWSFFLVVGLILRNVLWLWMLFFLIKLIKVIRIIWFFIMFVMYVFE